MKKEKKFEDLTKEETKELKIIFDPGCFDAFDGTQEELDALMEDIKAMVKSGELFEKSTPVDLDKLIDEDPELATMLLSKLMDDPRKLQ